MGLGYVSMQQQDFNKAIEYYEQAGQTGTHSAELTSALADARFWAAMKNGEGALPRTMKPLLCAISIKPAQFGPMILPSLEASGRALMQMNQPEKAVTLFEESVKLNENRPEAWMNWFGALVQTGRSREVIADQRYIPADVNAKLVKDPEYISILAASELQTGNNDSFQTPSHSTPQYA